MRYDVVVAGAGTAGLFAAYRLASTGLSVAVVEMKRADDIGSKVCGDAVGEHHFRAVSLEPPRVGVDAVAVFEGVRVYAPSLRGYVTAWGKGYALNRKAFGQRLLRMAVNAGADLLDGRAVVRPIVEGSWVRGVETHSASGGTEEVRARVVVEATGVSAAVRTKLPSEWWVSERAPPEDFNVAYRAVAEVEEPQDPKLALIYLDPEAAPGGYWWWFPKGEGMVNAGIGVRAGRGSPSPRDRFDAHVRPRLLRAGARIIHEGGGLVPTRRTAPCMVWNGLVAVGDAAMTANPIHGGGIGPSLVSSYHAAETIIRALSDGEPSMDALWPYHRAYHAAYGAKQASLDVLRIYLQSLSSSDLDFVIEKGIVTDAELSEMGYKGVLLSSIIFKGLRALKLLSRPSLLRELKLVKEYMDRARRLYEGYPSTPKEYPKWRAEEERLFSEVKSRFWSSGA